VLCEPRGEFDLGPEDLRFMQVLAGTIAARLEQVQGDVARLTARFTAN
jgi:hypothetical protein